MTEERVKVISEDAFEMLEVVEDYDAGNGPEPCVHTFRNAPFGLIGAHWSLDQVKAAIVECGVELSGPEATAMEHGLVLQDDNGPLFIATRSVNADS